MGNESPLYPPTPTLPSSTTAVGTVIYDSRLFQRLLPSHPPTSPTHPPSNHNAIESTQRTSHAIPVGPQRFVRTSRNIVLEGVFPSP